MKLKKCGSKCEHPPTCHCRTIKNNTRVATEPTYGTTVRGKYNAGMGGGRGREGGRWCGSGGWYPREEIFIGRSNGWGWGGGGGCWVCAEKISQNNSLAPPPLGFTPPSLENPGSAIDIGSAAEQFMLSGLPKKKKKYHILTSSKKGVFSLLLAGSLLKVTERYLDVGIGRPSPQIFGRQVTCLDDLHQQRLPRRVQLERQLYLPVRTFWWRHHHCRIHPLKHVLQQLHVLLKVNSIFYNSRCRISCRGGGDSTL